MAEGLFGDEEENNAGGPSAAEAPVGADAFAAAVAARLSAHDPEVARDTSAFLREQAELVKLQKTYLEDEHELRLSHLRHQSHLLRGPRRAQTLRITFQVLAVVVAGVIGGGVILMLHDAFTSRGVVIEPFDVPAELAARGLTGKVLAAGLLGELNRLQSATRRSAAKRELANAWSNEIRLALPEAGISIGALSRLLKARFGHDLHIDGDVVQTPNDALAFTVRGDGVPPKTFAGAASELAKLTSEAAEYVYSQSEPALYATYLSNAGRDTETVAFCRAAFRTASPADRPYLLNTGAIGLQNTGAPLPEALALFRAAVKLKPDFWVGSTNVQNTLWGLGDEEGAWRAGEDMRQAAGERPGRAPEQYYNNWDALTWNLPAWLDSTNADASAGAGTFAGALGPNQADIAARMHDSAAAELALATTRPDSHDPTIAAMTHFVHGALAEESGDVKRAAAEMEDFQAANENPVVSSNYAGYLYRAAPVEEAAGHPDKADAILNTTGTFVDCYRFRGDILDARGDWPGAQKAYAAAVALAPDLPVPYYSWGRALARHGDVAGAEQKLKDANERGPHWADPLKVWGDVLAKAGRTKEALAKYDAALKNAPNWAVLNKARTSAAKEKT